MCFLRECLIYKKMHDFVLGGILFYFFWGVVYLFQMPPYMINSGLCNFARIYLQVNLAFGISKVHSLDRFSCIFRIVYLHFSILKNFIIYGTAAKNTS